MDHSRCPATDTLTVGGEDLALRCVHWGPGGQHLGDHLIHTPAVTDDHTWTNDDPLPAE